MESEKKLSKLPSTAKVVGGFALLVAIFAAAFYVFQYRVVNEKNTLTDGVPNNVGENIDAKTSQLNKEEVIEWYETSIAAMETRVDKMEKKAIEAGDDVQDSYKASLANMETELDTMRLQLKQVKEATEDNWDALKTKIDETKARIEEKLKNDSSDYPA